MATRRCSPSVWRWKKRCVNAIKHGHHGDPSKEVQLRYHFTTECILAEIEDQGSGFKPEDVPDPLRRKTWKGRADVVCF